MNDFYGMTKPMSEPEQPDLSELPKAVPSRSKWGPLPLVWLLPIIVVLAGGFVVVHEKLAQGVTVHISFHNADGLEANKTKIRYKDVEIGEVSDIRVADDRKEVIVTAQIQRNAKEYMTTDTRFWVVRPRISAAGITGLGTLVSGEYISVDVGQSKIKSENFVGLEVPPIVTSDLPGREFVLHAEDLGSGHVAGFGGRASAH
jgi:paraquat-inducible protein B